MDNAQASLVIKTLEWNITTQQRLLGLMDGAMVFDGAMGRNRHTAGERVMQRARDYVLGAGRINAKRPRAVVAAGGMTPKELLRCKTES